MDGYPYQNSSGNSEHTLGTLWVHSRHTLDVGDGDCVDDEDDDDNYDDDDDFDDVDDDDDDHNDDDVDVVDVVVDEEVVLVDVVCCFVVNKHGPELHALLYDRYDSLSPPPPDNMLEVWD